MKYFTFLFYTLAWDGAILYGTYYATFVLGFSGWWWLLALVLMGSSYKPHHFDIGPKRD